MYITDEIDRLAPIIGENKVASLKSAYLLEDREGREKIIQVIDAIKALITEREEFSDTLLMQPPLEEISTGKEMELGKVLYGKKEMYPYTINKNDLLTHMGIFGSSGYGKTNFVYSIIQELNKQEIPIIIFDFSKRNYRDLFNIPELKNKINIFTIGRNVSPFRLNPLIPPEGVDLSQWIKEFAEIFDHAYWLMGGGRNIVEKALDEIYKIKETPRMSDLREWMRKYAANLNSSREKNWMATAQRPLDSLCFRETNDVFDCDKGVKIESFFEKGKINIIELDSLSTNDRTFFIEIMLQWIRDWLITKQSREKLKGAIILEEAHHILNREKAKRFGMETVMDLIFREIRELGMGIIYADQHPSLISYPALGNTSINIYMNLGLDTKSSSDIVDASSMLGLKTDEETDYLRRLPVGTSFLVNRKSEFTHPFLIRFPFVNIERGNISDEDIKKYMQSKMVEFYNNLKIQEDQEINPCDQDFANLDLNDWKIIETIGKGNGGYSSEIYKQLKMSGSTFKKVIEKLRNYGILYQKGIRIYKQNLIYYYFTKKGKSIFETRYGESKIKDTISCVTKEKTKEKFLGKGWKIVEENCNNILFHNGKRYMNLIFIEKNDDIKLNVDNIIKTEIVFVYSDEESKNIAIQKILNFSNKAKINFQFTMSQVDEIIKSEDLKVYQII